jgi:hypothetical protein
MQILGGVSSGGIPANYLVVAGGGGGGGVSDGRGGAGGGGGVRCTKDATGGGGGLESPFAVILGTTYTITVGTGGAIGKLALTGTTVQ